VATIIEGNLLGEVDRAAEHRSYIT